MEEVTVIYRNQNYPIKIDSNKSVIDLKKEISRLTSIKPDKFELQINEIEMTETKVLSAYTQFGTKFKMIKTIISIKVEINGINYIWNAPESYSINNFIRQISTEYNYDEQMTLYHKGEKLNDKSTFLLCGVENNDVLTAKDLKPTTKVIRTVTVSYKDKDHSIKIYEDMTVRQFKERVSQLTKIKVENFSLKIGMRLLLDSKTMSNYISHGTKFEMVNITIKVIVAINGDIYAFYVNESSTIDAFMKDIENSGHSPDFNLYFDNKILTGAKTVQAEGIGDNSLVIAAKKNPIIRSIEKFIIEYRSVSHSFDIDPTKMVADLKNLVQLKILINTKDFSLGFHWILLEDNIPLSEYIKYGTKFTMTDVTISVLLSFEGRNFNLTAKESMKIKDFKGKINDKIGSKDDFLLHYNNQSLDDNETLLDAEVEHRGTIFVVAILKGGCRYRYNYE